MRLIDADVLYLELSKEASHCLALGTKTGVSWATALQDAKRRLRSAPTIEAEPVRHGRWLWKCRHFGGFRKYTGVDEFGETHTITVDERSECDEPYCPYCGKWNESVFRNYCPNCGAKMEEVEA